jgi:universal stress protein A
MKIKSILFPTDFSHYNDAALEFASTLAAEANATLQIVHVHAPQDLNAALVEAGYTYELTWRDAERVANERMEQVVPTDRSVKYEHHYLTGEPVSAILGFVAENDIDLIVMASHGRSGLPRLLMGSIAEGVMRRAHCPVLVVKQPVGNQESAQAPAAHAANS